MCVAVRSFFSDGSLFCLLLLVHIKHVFFAHVRVCTLEKLITGLHDVCLHATRVHMTVQVKNGVLLFWREQKRTKNCWNLF
jgi:hypothetical protein